MLPSDGLALPLTMVNSVVAFEFDKAEGVEESARATPEIAKDAPQRAEKITANLTGLKLIAPSL